VSLPRLLVFASGTEEGGGSGFVKLVEASRDGVLQAEIVGVVSNHTNGGVRQKADGLNVPFLHFDGPFNAQNYQDHVCNTQAEFVSLSGWLKLVAGLDPRMTINIHPGPLPYLGYTQDFGGPGMYGHHVHEAVMQAYHVGKLTESRVSMHFVTEKYDEGPVFFSHPVPILTTDNAEKLGTRVNKFEHQWQAIVTNLVVRGQIHWDGEDPDSLVVPAVTNVPHLVGRAHSPQAGA